MRKNYTGRSSHNPYKRSNSKTRLALFTMLTMAAIVFGGLTVFRHTHFGKNTTINGTDCSYMTVEQAFSKINEEISSTSIGLSFLERFQFISGSKFGLSLGTTDELYCILDKQVNDKNLTEFSLTSLDFSEEQLRDTLQSLPEFQPENMVYPQNAYVTFSEEDNLLSIVPESSGNVIDFEEAFSLAVSRIKAKDTLIDFSSITLTTPKVTSSELQQNVSEINSILSTSITFNITDNISMVLDKTVMKDWLNVSEDGTYSIDVESNLPLFIEELANKSAKATVYIQFDATNLGPITIPAKNLSIDKEAETKRILSCLGTAETYTFTPTYNLSDATSYVEIDIGRQHVWMYVDGVCIVNTDCVTGNKGNHDTRPGYFFLASKSRNVTLRGNNDNGTRYASFVYFWMPFDGGIGLHDATWRNSFGSNIYMGNGSHGCVNLPKVAAETIYNNITFSMPIIVYDSSSNAFI